MNKSSFAYIKAERLSMLEFLAEHFSDCVILAVFIVAILPTIESRVAIPFALASAIWGEATLSPFMAFLVSFLGTMLPSIFVIWLSRKLKNKTSGFVYDKFVIRIQNKYKKKFEKLEHKRSILKKCLLLGSFVAVPLPLTGVYTGSLIAGFTNLKIWQCFISILVGELISCVGIVILCTLFENSAYYLFLMSVLIGVLFLVANVVIYLINKFKKHELK
ncbi:MAG: COG2426 family protein [Candidatus Caccovivens sp.]